MNADQLLAIAAVLFAAVWLYFFAKESRDNGMLMGVVMGLMVTLTWCVVAAAFVGIGWLIYRGFA